MLESIAKLPDPAIPSQVAEALYCKPSYIQALCKSGEIRCSKVGKRYLISRRAVQQFVDSREVKKCQNDQRDPTSSGGGTMNAGQYDGLSAVESVKNQRALDLATKLKKPLSGSSSTKSPSGRVIPLRPQ
jgi:excisionase family DNA binding protein